MEQLIVKFIHRRPGGFPYQPEVIEVEGERAGGLPQVGDMYSFDGSEYFRVVQRKFFIRDDRSYIEIVCDDH